MEKAKRTLTHKQKRSANSRGGAEASEAGGRRGGGGCGGDAAHQQSGFPEGRHREKQGKRTRSGERAKSEKERAFLANIEHHVLGMCVCVMRRGGGEAGGGDDRAEERVATRTRVHSCRSWRAR